MFPELIRLDGFALHTYGVLVATGFLAGVAFSLREGRRVGLDPEQVLNLCFYLVLSAIVGSRLLYILMYLDEYLRSPLEIVKIWKGGLVFSGGLIGALITGLLYVRRHGMGVGTVADVMAPGIALGQAIGRIGCFFAGCCYGRPTDAFCAVVFNHPQTLAPIGIPIHPTQLYASAALFMIFGILWAFRSRKRWDGQVMCLYLSLHSVVRLILEHFRDDYRGEVLGGLLTVTQTTSLLILAASLAVWIHAGRRRSK